MVVSLPYSEMFIRNMKDALVVFFRASELQHTSCITNTKFEVCNCVASLQNFAQRSAGKAFSVVLKEFCFSYCLYLNFSEIEVLCDWGCSLYQHTVAKCFCRTGLRRGRHIIPSSQPLKLVTHKQTSVCNKIMFSK